MEFIADFHIHSKYSGACSDKLTLPNIDLAAHSKGIDVIATGDFTHPKWMSDIKLLLEPQDNGLFKLKGSKTGVAFIASVEVCTISPKVKGAGTGRFDRTGSVAKIHHCVLSPDIESMEQISAALSKYGNMEMDGRPQLEMSAAELVEIVHEVNDRNFIFSSHAWTPWYGVFGSMSGFDSVDAAYEDQAKRIYALESGLSADPPMFWQVSSLDKYAILSNSDAHSLPKLGREANIIELQSESISYSAIISAIKEKKIKSTVEFYPEEGKYHYDGHRKCNVSLSPEEARKYNYICPVCGKKLTLGVLHRVNELADREQGKKPSSAIPFVHAVPLQEVISFVSKKSAYSRYVADMYDRFIAKFGTEFDVLLKAKVDDLREVDDGIATAIENVRNEHVRVKPGYDGVFGVVDILNGPARGRGGMGQGHGQKTVTEFLQKP